MYVYPVMTCPSVCLSVSSHLSSKLWSNQTYFAATYGHHNVTLQNQQVMLAIPSKTKRHRRVVSVNQYLANNHEVFRYKRFNSRYPQAASFLPLEEDPTSPIMRHLVHVDGIEPPPHFKVPQKASSPLHSPLPSLSSRLSSLPPPPRSSFTSRSSYVQT